MTYKENITAILECFFTGFKEEIIDSACNRILEQERTTKNDLGVDCISRAEMLRYQQYLHGKMSNEENHKLWEFIKELPSVTPQEPRWILLVRGCLTRIMRFCVGTNTIIGARKRYYPNMA